MTDSALDISVVVVTFNSAHCIEHCLTTITERLRPLEIVVVDNASADGSADAARRAAPEAIVIDSGENLGFGRACNLGAERARCTTVLFVNPDVGITAVDRAELEAVLGRPQLGLLVPALASSHEAPRQHQVFPYRPWRRTIMRQTWAYLRPRELQHAPRPARVGERTPGRRPRFSQSVARSSSPWAASIAASSSTARISISRGGIAIVGSRCG